VQAIVQLNFRAKSASRSAFSTIVNAASALINKVAAGIAELRALEDCFRKRSDRGL
jgi:hypothetical protein